MNIASMTKLTINADPSYISPPEISRRISHGTFETHVQAEHQVRAWHMDRGCASMDAAMFLRLESGNSIKRYQAYHKFCSHTSSTLKVSENPKNLMRNCQKRLKDQRHVLKRRSEVQHFFACCSNDATWSHGEPSRSLIPVVAGEKTVHSES